MGKRLAAAYTANLCSVQPQPNAQHVLFGHPANCNMQQASTSPMCPFRPPPCDCCMQGRVQGVAPGQEAQALADQQGLEAKQQVGAAVRLCSAQSCIMLLESDRSCEIGWAAAMRGFDLIGSWGLTMLRHSRNDDRSCGLLSCTGRLWKSKPPPLAPGIEGSDWGLRFAVRQGTRRNETATPAPLGCWGLGFRVEKSSNPKPIGVAPIIVGVLL